LLHEIERVGRMAYRSFSDDAEAIGHARDMLADFDNVTIYDGQRIVLRPGNQIRC
jgi:hypothetical protein